MRLWYLEDAVLDLSTVLSESPALNQIRLGRLLSGTVRFRSRLHAAVSGAVAMHPSFVLTEPKYVML